MASALFIRLFPEARTFRIAFVLALAIFVVSRLVTLTTFPIFNDEAIYLQYSQAIHDDWNTNKFISLDNKRGDWKPPLQYWLAAPFIKWGNDPLVVGRSVALAVSIFGFFGIYAFARELFGEREAVLSTWLWVFCPAVFFYNDQFIAEPFLFSIAPFVYWSLLKAMKPGARSWPWVLIALFFAVLLLFLKQSGLLLLGVSLFLPFTRLSSSTLDKPHGSSVRNPAINLALGAGVIVLSTLAVYLLLPAKLNAQRDKFHEHLLFSPGDLAAFPTGLWWTNLKMAGDYVGHYYTWCAAAFVGVAIWSGARRAGLRELALGAMCLSGGGGIIFLLRQPNEYLFNAAVIVSLVPLLARAGLLTWDLRVTGTFRLVLVVIAAITIGYWSYQDILMGVSPGRFFEQNTAWAKENYLRRWSNGFGIKEVVATLEKEKRNGVILADPQWGNPRAALEVYHDRFPNLQIVPFRRAMLDPAVMQEFLASAQANASVRFVVFSASIEPPRSEWQSVIKPLCADRTEVKIFSGQTPIIVCRF